MDAASSAAGAIGEQALESLKRKMSLRRCEICSTEEAKYRCPRCMKYSCSLACVKKHKTVFTCNGIREKTAFVSMNEFNDLNLLSDYRFLEDVGRLADTAARDESSHRPKSNKFVNFLKNRARRYSICLQTLPIGFTKRRENSTYFSNKEHKFYWHLKLVFPHSDATFTEKRVPDDKPLCDILKPYIDAHESNPVIYQRLKIYAISPKSDIQILMKVEKRPNSSIRYEELDANKGLLENLKGKVIIEYPTLHVVLQNVKTDMVILGHDANKSSDDLIKGASSEEEGEIHDST
ncbi:Box C/D snoRNA protein 1 [Varanus komodoensis]|uniref:box C/D snoRNA protein 1 isoform X1 n=2 Tax=Varanus komodoensis TaxID=61221 RepID=UPI001CF7B405|nr:box C/D snoRNA protein 1 isoform X1 [Varanus komodoensis]KAF7243447.1 Box C/D snoRNA protein 1 [Varanus komodoensis]